MIDSPGVEGMAFYDSFYRQPTAPDGSKSFDGFHPVVGTGWVKSAGWRLEGRNDQLVQANERQEYFLHDRPPW
jgi:hypothetical protein